jgi:carbon monoxide dehydrogenase subunit G
MITFEKSIFINRPQQEVFDFVSNRANDSQWQSGGGSTEKTSEGLTGLGTTYRSTTNLIGRGIESTTEIISWDAPNELSEKTTSGPIPFEGKTTFSPKENGTQLTFSGQAELGGFFKMAEGLVGKQMEKQIDTDLNALKLLLEQG